MGVGAQIKRRIARHLLSPARRDAQWARFERQRKRKGLPHKVSYFHDVADPYSQLMVQVLPNFLARYDVELKPYLVPTAPDWAAPDRPRLDAYAREDAEQLAARAELSFKHLGKQPNSAEIAKAQAALISATDTSSFLALAKDVGAALWARDAEASPVASLEGLERALSKNAQTRERLGHYLGGTLHYGGEWYWGLDRLHYLESRLRDLGAARAAESTGLIAPPPELQFHPPKNSNAKTLHWYISFRSPYTAISADRVKALADHYGAELKIRYVLPMVMRGMAVPRAKRMYIVKDVAREAERLGLPFGDIVDPLGTGVERGYAVLQHAVEQGLGFVFARSFLRGVWSEGIDASTDRGLRILTQRAGLDWRKAKNAMERETWRELAEQNRSEMARHGVWGVPSFRVDDNLTWGQDRLWLVENALQE